MTHKERYERRGQIAHDIKGGMSLVEAVRKWGVTQNTIHRAMAENGVYSPRIPSHRMSDKRRQEIASEVEAGGDIVVPE